MAGKKDSDFFSNGDLMQAGTPGVQWRFSNRGPIWHPPTDLFETETEVIVKIEAAGMSDEDFNLNFSRGRLYISGTRKDPSPKVCYHQMEISYGKFETVVSVEQAVDVENIRATYKEGFLVVVMPKLKARGIPIQSE